LREGERELVHKNVIEIKGPERKKGKTEFRNQEEQKERKRPD
jgi:hypothetical protein